MLSILRKNHLARHHHLGVQSYILSSLLQSVWTAAATASWDLLLCGLSLANQVCLVPVLVSPGLWDMSHFIPRVSTSSQYFQ